MSTKKLPVHAERFEHRLNRIKKQVRENSVILRIEGMVALECASVLEAYYGSKWKAGKNLLTRSISEKWNDACGSLIWGFSDWMKWTRIHNLPNGHQMRHGHKCDGTCEWNDDEDGEDCIRRGLPKWYRKFTDWWIGR